MNSSSEGSTSTPCARRGRPPGVSKKAKKILNITGRKDIPSTPDDTSSNVYICGAAIGFDECIFRICAFFASIYPRKPMEVNLKTLALLCRRHILRNPFSFARPTWSIPLLGKTVSGYFLDATNTLDKRCDSFNLEIFSDGSVIIHNLNYWFSMAEHKFTIFKFEGTVIAITKFKEKYYVYDPNNDAVSVNSASSCIITECFDIEQLATIIQNRIEEKDSSSCILMCHLIAITVTSPHFSTISHSDRRSETTEDSDGRNKDVDTEICGSSAKRATPCTDDLPSDLKVVIRGTCAATTNKNTLFMQIFSLFCSIDVDKPREINMDSVLRTSDDFLKMYPDFNIEKFDYLDSVYEGEHKIIYKIFGYNKLSDELYEMFNFVISCEETVLLRNLQKWFAMGYHEKSVLYFSYKVFGVLKSKEKYYLFDPNECLSAEGNMTSDKRNITFTECDDIQDLANNLYASLNNKGKSVICTVIAVNTLTPIQDTDIYVITDPPSYERSAKVRGRINISTLLSKENELRLQEQQKKLRENVARIRVNMNEQEREEAHKKMREYSARRWRDMNELERDETLKTMREYSVKRWTQLSEAEREEALKQMREYSAKRWTQMSEAEREEALEQMRENRTKRWRDMNEAEREEALKQMREYSAKRWTQMSEAEREEALEQMRENRTKRWRDMNEAEREEALKQMRENSAKRWTQMSEAERADELRRNALNLQLRRAEMSEEETKEARQKQRDYEARRVAAMNAEERREYREKHREYEVRKRNSMTTEARTAIKLKAKERYRNNHKEVARRLEMTASIKKRLKFKGKKGLIKDNVVVVLGGRPENHMEAESIVNANLQHREQLLNQQTRALVTLFYSFKNRKEKCDTEVNIEDKIVAMFGTSLHTIHSEAYFPDTTYRSISSNTYSLNENGLLESVALRNHNGEDNIPSTWYCDDRCDIDVVAVYNRFYSIIEVVLKSTETELITFIENIDYCDNRASADVGKLGHPKECYIHNGNNYGCSSVLLFFRSISPHYPFLRNIVSAIYKVRRELKKLREIDEAINTLDIAELRRISDELKEKSSESFVPTTDWPYANETSITDKYLSAFVALQRSSADLPTIVCISCMELCFQRNVRHIQDFYPDSSISDKWDDLLDFHQQHNYKYGQFICHYCFDKFSKEKTLPPTCLLNNLQVRDPPLCITRLNDYEKMLIQRAKAFQVVTRMGGVAKKNRPRQEMVQKVIGRTFHLPLPIEQTLEKMPKPYQAIAAKQDLYILVRGMPSKQKQIFQSFVNVNYVYEALQWLQSNNHLYKYIRLPPLPENILDELDDLEDVQFNLDNIRSQTDESSTDPPAMLTPKDVGDSFYEHVTLHSIGAQRPNDQPSTVYQLKKVFDKPIDNRETDLDIRCFPHLFCYGENGQFATRQQNLPLRQFMKNRVKSVYSQFRLNVQYLFFLLNTVNMRQIAASIYTAMNITPQTKNMTAKILKEKMAKNEFDKNALSIFTSLRNSKAFWNKPRSDINCMLKYYGPATWFLTISPSEYHWNDLEKYLREINGEHATGKTFSALIAMDPISTSRFIDNKFKAMLTFICSPDGPLGEVEHYVWRREYQSRGLQHFHLMIWIKGAPTLGESTNEEVSDFICKYATCHVPDKNSFPTLYSRVMSYQQHYHNSYCMRSKKTKRGGFIKRCRFEFPRPVTSTITLRDVATSIHGRRKLKLKSRLYDLRRSEAEVNVNDYNPAILLAWEGNMDIQFIGEKSGALCAYITKYNTKPEKSYVGDGFSDIAATKPLYSKLWLMGQRILSNRECGTLEAADTLLQISLFGTDNNTTIKWLDVRKERNGKLREWNHVQNLAEDDTDLFFPSLIDTHYPNRPAALKNVSLFDFASKYEIGKTKPKRSEEFYEYGKLFIKRRKTICLINHYNYNMEKDSEKYFYALLLLYKPFTNESELLGSFKTYAESFDNCRDELPDALQYHDKLQQIARTRNDLDEVVKLIEAGSEERENDNACGSQNALGPHDAITDMRTCLGINNISDNDLSQMVNTLNVDQLRVFNKITSILLQQSRGDPNTKALRQFVSGVGGTGKSHLIKVIRQWVKNELDGDVIVAAPTGIAAQNVNGLTIHRFLNLPVEHGSTPEYKELSDINLQKLKNELHNVKLIIIDEISMVSNFLLLFIHLRLQEVYNTFQKEDGWFGGRNILFFGDLLQLSPVTPDCPFVTVSATRLTNMHSSVPCDLNLWADLFSYDELTINVRQQADRTYANMLSRIRLGIMNENDQEELEGRLLHFTSNNTQEGYLQELVTQLQSLPSSCVCLFATKKQCAQLNSAMLSLLTGDDIILKATDEIDTRNNIQRQKAQDYLKKIADDSNQTAAVEDTVIIKIGCKVMLRRNISRTLVNGSIGIVLEVIKDGMDESISKIKIQFNNEEHLLERLQVKFEVFKNVYVIRSQFPITLAYGITIHKSQSLSLECCMIDIGNSIFCAGQTYVALSRVTSLNGLYLVNYDPTKVLAKDIAIYEYNRLRRLYRPDLNEIAITPNNATSRRDILWWKKGFVDVDPVDDSDNPVVTLPGFRNENNNCFANATLQCLLCITSINRNIMLSQDSPLKRLAFQYNDPNNVLLNSDDVIQHVQYRLGEMQDATEFIAALIHFFPSITRELQFTTEEIRKCSSCNYEYKFNYIVPEHHNDVMYKMALPTAAEISALLQVSKSKNAKSLTMDDLLRHAYSPKELDNCPCPRCNARGFISNRIKINNAGNVFITALNIFEYTNNSVNRLPLKLNRVPASMLEVAGSKYKLKAAIFHHGDNQFTGHYTAYVTANNRWYLLNDTNVSLTRWPQLSRHVYVLFYEKQ